MSSVLVRYGSHSPSPVRIIMNNSSTLDGNKCTGKSPTNVLAIPVPVPRHVNPARQHVTASPSPAMYSRPSRPRPPALDIPAVSPVHQHYVPHHTSLPRTASWASVARGCQRVTCDSPSPANVPPPPRPVLPRRQPSTPALCATQLLRTTWPPSSAGCRRVTHDASCSLITPSSACDR